MILIDVVEIKPEIEPEQRRKMETQQNTFGQSQANTSTQKTTNAPEKKFVAGGISATVWANEKELNGAPVAVHTISLQRTYKDRDGQWKQSASMRINDIPKAQLVLEKAYEYLTLKESGNNAVELM